MLRSGWKFGEGEHRRGGDLCAGSGVSFAGMEKLKATASVWGADEAFLSPPEYGSSLGGSMESEESCEDSEDYISGLAEEIAQSMLQEDEEASFKSVSWRMKRGSKPSWNGQQMASSPTSPQSTLAGMGGYTWDARSPGGNMGSSGVSSPPTPQEGDAVDVLYADLLRVKLEDQVKLASQQQLLSRQQQIIQRPASLSTANVSPLENHLPLDKIGFLKSGKVTRSKNGGQETENHPVRGGSKQVGGVWGSGSLGASGGRGILTCKRREGAGPQQQQQYQQFSLFASNPESGRNSTTNSNSGDKGRKQEEGGLRAVFLGSTTSRECGGTGVFLPRRPQDSKRKPACSTVLLPSHIVHALNLRIEDTLPSPNRRDLWSPSSQGPRNPQVASRRSKTKDEVMPSYFPTSHATTLQEVAPDISLPSEWTY